MAEFPDIFACVSCDKALFLDEDERTLEKHACPFCHHEHIPEDVLQGEALGEEAGVEVAEDDAVDAAPTEPPETESTDDERAEETSSIDEPDGSAVEQPDETAQEPAEEALSTEEPDEPAHEAAAESEEEAVVEELNVNDAPAEDLELPDVFVCLSCDNALFLNETERATGEFSCPHCGQENRASETRAMAAKQLEAVEESAATPAEEKKFEELIECPECDRAIKLMPEQRDDDSVDCPYCKTTIAAPEPPAEEEPMEEVAPESTEPGDAEPVETQQEDAPQEESVEDAVAETADPDAEDTADEPESEVADEQEEAPLTVDEDRGGEELSAESQELTEDEEGEAVEGSTDEVTTDEESKEAESEEAESEESGGILNKTLLESLIEASRSESLMPEQFSCPKCEQEIQLPEPERVMGLCFCPECEELIEAKTASERSTKEPEAVENEQGATEESPAEEGVEPAETDGEATTGDPQPDEPDPAAPQEEEAEEEAAPEREFWLVEVMPGSVDCAKCGNSIKLDKEEKTFGLYRCPYCKEDINHAKGAVVESLLVISSGEEAEDEITPKKKAVNFKALLPYAAVLVFGVALNYSVIRVTNYLQEKKALKTQRVSMLKKDQSEMQERPKVYRDALENSANKVAFGRLDEMSLDELKQFRARLMKDKEDSYAKWFERTGDEIAAPDSLSGQVVLRFQGKLNRFMRRVKLAKIDVNNLETAIGMSLFERQRAQELLREHMTSIREQMGSLSTDEAIDQGLVRREVLVELMALSLKVDDFEMHSVKQAAVHLDSMTKLANRMEERYELSHSPHPDKAHAPHPDEGHASHPAEGHASHPDEGHASHPSAGPGTLWNAEVKHWQKSMKERELNHQSQWEDVVLEYRHLMELFSDFHNQLKALRKGLDLSQVTHPFLDGGVLALRVDGFGELEGVGDLVRHDVETRLERLAKLLDPYAPGSLAYDLQSHKARGAKLTHDQANEFYKRFWEQWKQFHLEEQWFELEGVSSYYHLARIGSTSSAKAHH